MNENITGKEKEAYRVFLQKSKKLYEAMQVLDYCRDYDNLALSAELSDKLAEVYLKVYDLNALIHRELKDYV